MKHSKQQVKQWHRMQRSTAQHGTAWHGMAQLVVGCDQLHTTGSTAWANTARRGAAHLWHVAVPMAQQIGAQLNRSPIPAVVGGGLAQHELGAAPKDGGDALGSCGGLRTAQHVTHSSAGYAQLSGRGAAHRLVVQSCHRHAEASRPSQQPQAC